MPQTSMRACTDGRAARYGAALHSISPHEVQDTGAFPQLPGFDTGGKHAAGDTSIHINALFLHVYQQLHCLPPLCHLLAGAHLEMLLRGLASVGMHKRSQA